MVVAAHSKLRVPSRTRTSTPRAGVTVAAHAMLLALLLPAAVSGQSWPDGWNVRPDRSGADLSEISFEAMPPGHHVTSGPAAIYWRDGDEAAGRYQVEFDVHLFDPQGRREAFGVFIGGRDLAGAGQSYTYFLIRDGGQFLVKERNGNETPTLVQWTAHPAILGWADREEGGASVLNRMRVEADEDEIRFYVNDAELTSVAREGRAEGIAGMRVNHALNLHIARLAISPLER